VVGCSLGVVEGKSDGKSLGLLLGKFVGELEGMMLGCIEGAEEGTLLGSEEGSELGEVEGKLLGSGEVGRGLGTGVFRCTLIRRGFCCCCLLGVTSREGPRLGSLLQRETVLGLLDGE